MIRIFKIISLFAVLFSTSCTTIYQLNELPLEEGGIYFVLKVDSELNRNEIILGKARALFVSHCIYLSESDNNTYLFVEGSMGEFGIDAINKHKIDLLGDPEILFEVTRPGIYYIGDFLISKSNSITHFPQIAVKSYDLRIVNNINECVENFDNLDIIPAYDDLGLVYAKYNI